MAVPMIGAWPSRSRLAGVDNVPGAVGVPGLVSTMTVQLTLMMLALVGGGDTVTGLTSVSPVQGRTGDGGLHPNRKSSVVGPGSGVGTAAPAEAGGLHATVLTVPSAGT